MSSRDLTLAHPSYPRSRELTRRLGLSGDRNSDSGQGRNVTSSAPNHDANADADGQIDADMDQLHEEPPSSGPSSEQTQVAATLATLATSSAPMAPSPVGPNPAPLPPGYNKASLERRHRRSHLRHASSDRFSQKPRLSSSLLTLRLTRNSGSANLCQLCYSS